MFRIAFVFALSLLATPILAADNTFPTPGNATAQGMVLMCLDGNGKAVAAGSSGCSIPVFITGPDAAEGGVSVQLNPFREDATVRAGSITVGGAWQMIAAANPARQRLFIQNYCSSATQGISASESVFLSVSPVMPPTSPLAAPTGIELVTCGSYDTSTAVVGTAMVWLWAATTGHRYEALEW